MRTLTELAQRISPLRDQMRDKLADLEPRLGDIDARLKGLGPPPARDAPAEDAAIAAERARLTQQRAEVDAAIKQVQLLQTRADQLANALSDRRRVGLCGDAVPPLAERARSRSSGATLSRPRPTMPSRLVQFGQNWIAYARDKGGAARAGVRVPGAFRDWRHLRSGWCDGGAGTPS